MILISEQSFASDVRPVSSGNEITYHLLEVAYSADKLMTKQMEEKFDAELMAVDLNQIVHIHLQLRRNEKPNMPLIVMTMKMMI